MGETTARPITKATIVRTISALLVILNLLLRYLGLNPLHIQEESLGALLEVLIEGAVIVAGWWWNNSFSPQARQAQAYLEQLRKSV